MIRKNFTTIVTLLTLCLFFGCGVSKSTYEKSVNELRRTNALLDVCMKNNELLEQGDGLERGLSSLSANINKSLPLNNNDKKTRIAVVEFANLDGQITALGKYVAEELTTRLFQTGRFDVVERQLLNKIIDEHKLSVSGFIDENTAKSIGKILGVDAIATGTITDLGKDVKINARIISAEKGSVFSVASVKIIKDLTVKNLCVKSNKAAQQTQSAKVTKKPIKKSFPKSKTYRDAGISMRAIDCYTKGLKTICEIEITAIEDDLELSISNKTAIFDNFGSKTKIIDITTRGGHVTTMRRYLSRRIQLIKGLPTPLKFSFDPVSEKATEISAFKLEIPYLKSSIIRGIPIRK